MSIPRPICPSMPPRDFRTKATINQWEDVDREVQVGHGEPQAELDDEHVEQDGDKASLTVGALGRGRVIHH